MCLREWGNMVGLACESEWFVRMRGSDGREMTAGEREKR